jgi:NAD(P)-dependent dehydrogenase (short-subunit alcohol dehydrogenase family)
LLQAYFRLASATPLDNSLKALSLDDGEETLKTKQQSFAGKVVLVTGATGGIGRATAQIFAQYGAKVVAAGRRVREGQEVVEQIKAQGGEALFVQADVTQERQVKALVETTLETYGQLDCAFNNAGTIGRGRIPFPENTEQDWEYIVNTNLKGCWYCLKQEIAVMLRQGYGTIVNNSSVAGLIGIPEGALYAATKHGIIGLTKSVALKYATSGIRVNAICPGGVETEILSHWTPDMRKQFESQHPVQRLAQPEEIATFVAYLSSDDASFITGQAFPIDGGYLAQ